MTEREAVAVPAQQTGSLYDSTHAHRKHSRPNAAFRLVGERACVRGAFFFYDILCGL